MDILLSSPYFAGFLFFIIAFAYSSVGLGGGSSYTALMSILGMNILAIPLVSLTLNLCVTTIGSFNFIRYHHARFNLIMPFLVGSIPMAYLGGSLNLPKEVFYWVLLVSLLFVATRIYFWKNTSIKLSLNRRGKIVFSLFSGGILGLIAGIVGIGGGVYLVPLIIIAKLGTEKEAAACGAIFIWLNSVAGLISRLQHNSINLADYLPYIIAVLIGGTIGSFLGSSKYSGKTMEKILGVVILVAIILLTRKIFLF
ncbi:MAG: sulfite exporter TauE/SafE family protein [Gammaproteobacteria bacterium]|nr:sulfite exporter TauE/SafE family protein [Gammaproteobacteria bacterium]